MAKQDSEKKRDPIWLHPEKPGYWDYLREETRKMTAEMAEAEKPRDLAFTLADVELGVVEEAIRRAKEFTGTANRSQALFHICENYLGHGPHARAYNSMATRKQILAARLENLLAEAGEEHALEILGSVFSQRQGGSPGRRK